MSKMTWEQKERRREARYWGEQTAAAMRQAVKWGNDAIHWSRAGITDVAAERTQMADHYQTRAVKAAVTAAHYARQSEASRS